MDNLRLMLIFSLAVVLVLIYQAWEHDYGAARRPIAEQQAPAAPAEGAQTLAAPPNQMAGQTADQGAQTAKVPEGLPDAAASVAAATPVPAPTDTQAVAAGTASPLAPIAVETDVLRLEISPKGGTIASVWLNQYPVDPERPEDKLRLFKPEPPNMFIAQSGLLGSDPQSVPTHEAIFTSPQASYRLGERDDILVVELTWGQESGVQVVKRYRFQRGSYLVGVTQEVRNGMNADLTLRGYTQLQRTELNDPNESQFVYTFTGGAYWTPEGKYRKVSFDDMRGERLSKPLTDGWVAMMQHYFVSAWVPPRGQADTLYTNVLADSRYIIGSYTPAVSLAPGASHSFEDALYIGPKVPETLAAIAPGLDLTVDYGMLAIIAQPIHWLLSKIHSVVGNWGWAIIILTILIKAIFYPLSEASYKSMAHMRQVAPRMQALKDRYGDDKERLNQAMMELYKKEKINPLGGCLPILIQIPVFIALYWVLLESVELRHAPFALWLTNLTAPDPYFVLPLLMGVSMYIQQKLNPQPPDPIQAKVMMALPFVFTVFFAFFPSGLVLYWTVNNLLSIAQQWHITRKIEAAAK
jgi:YidC/Oxa1 family membrane protein insertase